MVNVPLSPLKLRLFLWHKGIGLTVFLTASARLLWRATHPAPEAVAMPAWQRRAAAATHAALYVLMFAIPLSGWVYSSATGVSVVYLGLIPLPDPCQRKSPRQSCRRHHATELHPNSRWSVCCRGGAVAPPAQRDGAPADAPFLR
jgi:cytochrome b561